MIAAVAPSIFARLAASFHAVNSRDLLTTSADVLIVFYVVYRILKLVRGTRAAQTMVGMAVLGGLFFLAKKLDLFAVSWLFEKLIDYFIIFFVVIFQQDLRRALMQVGQNLFMRRQYEETYVIEEVVQAAVELAKQRIGALIAIERDADLSEHLGEVGVELDARVTKELLLTLFLPEPLNHMHDGAVIIRNLRVQQAGAVLPLSANAKLDKQFGTRHRAAIGITEETDAVVVVVSEERGAVSLCFNGNIARDLDAATLRKALLGLFQKKKNKAKGQQPAPRPRPAGEASHSSEAKSSALSVGSLTGVPGDSHEPRQSEKLPADLVPLFTTQQLNRPPLPEENGGPAAPPPAATPGTPDAAVQPSLHSGEITQPIASASQIGALAEKAHEAYEAAEQARQSALAQERPATAPAASAASPAATGATAIPKAAETR
jgi:uncharacterized protein (TIGR00159 family)